MSHMSYEDTIVPIEGKVSGNVRITWVGPTSAYAHDDPVKYGDPVNVLTFRGREWRYVVRAELIDGKWVCDRRTNDNTSVSVHENILFNIADAPRTFTAAIRDAVLTAITDAATPELLRRAAYVTANNDADRAREDVNAARAVLDAARIAYDDALARMQAYRPE